MQETKITKTDQQGHIPSELDGKQATRKMTSIKKHTAMKRGKEVN